MPPLRDSRALRHLQRESLERRALLSLPQSEGGMLTLRSYSHGGEEHFAVRNLINAAGFMCYSYGATRVATRPYQLNDAMRYRWTPLVGAMVFSTLQMQDMSDQEGDAQKGRGTLPLVWGDGTARWSIAVPVVVWSCVCPAFWQMDYWGWGLPLVLGVLVSGRVLLLRGVEQDKVTWKFWCVWTMALYLLPTASFLSIP